MVTPIRLYPLNCTLYCCTLTRRQPSALVALSSAFVSDFLFQVLQCTLHWLQLSQHFLFAISFRNQQFFLNSFFCWKWAGSYHNAWLWTHHSLLLEFLYPLAQFNPVCSYIFSCVAFQPLYEGPYAVLRCGPCSFTIRVGSRDEVVAVSRLKACTAADTMPGSPSHRITQVVGFLDKKSILGAISRVV